MRYVLSKASECREDKAYRIYVTDSLQNIPQNRHLTRRYEEIINYKVDTRSGDEIAADVIKKAGLKVG